MDREDEQKTPADGDDRRAERRRRREAERAAQGGAVEATAADAVPAPKADAGSAPAAAKAASGDDKAARRQRREAERTTVQADGGGRTGPVQFLKEVRGELRRVAWPTRHEVVNYTIVVLAITTLLTLITFGMDFVLRNITVELFG